MSADRLAIRGGKPAVDPSLARAPWPVVDEEDLQAVKRVFDGGRFTSMTRGETEVSSLEEEYARYVGTRYCVATSSGTSALHTAVAAAGVGPGDEVIVPALTFVASATAVLHHQGIPVFADVDPVSYNVDPAAIEAAVGGKTRAIMMVHMHGLPADVDEIRAIASRHGLVLIEDASQAQSAVYRGRMTGSLGDVAGTSVMAAKNLPACGEGGLFTTDSREYRDRADMLRQFGERIVPGEERRYNSYTLGWNYRLNPIQAAFLRSQLRRLDELTEGRRRDFARLSDELGKLPGIVPPVVPPDRTHVFYLYRFRVDPAAAGLDGVPVGRFRKALHRILWAEGVIVGEYQNAPVPGQALFQLREGYGKGCPWSCPHAGPVSYRVEDYPRTLEVIESTLVMQKLFSPSDRRVIDAYVGAFQKVFKNLDFVKKYAGAIPYSPPWAGGARPY